MASNHEQSNNRRCIKCESNSAFASEIPVRRHADFLPSSNNSEEQIIALKSRKVKQPLDYLIWSSMLVVSGTLICGFVTVTILIAAYKSM